MTKIVEDAIGIIKQHGIYCPFKMAVPCKRNKSRSACSFDGKCCSWTKINFPQEWLKCKKYVEFVELMIGKTEKDTTTIHNPVTGKNYTIRKRSSKNMNAGQIQGLWHSKNKEITIINSPVNNKKPKLEVKK